MRAQTIPVDEVFGVAGFVLPGDRVDVILTRSLKAGDLSTSQADVLVQNVKVLAIDQKADQRLDAPSISSAVTLEVDSEMAQKLVLGGSIGRLSLTLRAAGSAHRAEVRPDIPGRSRRQWEKTTRHEHYPWRDRRADDALCAIGRQRCSSDGAGVSAIQEWANRIEFEIRAKGATRGILS